MTLEGQQNSLMNIDNRRFKIIVHDTAGSFLVIQVYFFLLRSRKSDLYEGCLESSERWLCIRLCDK
jgi:hypothetical protein